MSECIELVFEDIVEEDLFDLIRELLLRTNSFSITYPKLTSDTSMEDLNRYIKDMFISKEDITIIILTENFIFNGLVVKSALFRILKYDTKYDVDISFDEDEINNSDVHSLVGELKLFSCKLASKFKISSCYAGLEPAIDKDTRFFTDNQDGPLES